jgi:hypothetical protein
MTKTISEFCCLFLKEEDIPTFQIPTCLVGAFLLSMRVFAREFLPPPSVAVERQSVGLNDAMKAPMTMMMG